MANTVKVTLIKSVSGRIPNHKLPVAKSYVRVVVSAAVWVRPVAVATKVRLPAPAARSLRASRVVSSRCTAVCRSSASFR